MEVDAIVNAGKNLPFYLWELVDDVCFLKAAQLLNCPWLPSTVKIQKVLVLVAQVTGVIEANVKRLLLLI